MVRAEVLSLMISPIVILIVSMPCTVLGHLLSGAPPAEAEKYLLDVCEETYSDNNKVMKYCVKPLKPYVASAVQDPFRHGVSINELPANAVEVAMDILKKALEMNQTQGLVKDKLCIDSLQHQNDTLPQYLEYIRMPTPDAGDLSPDFEFRIVSPWKQCEKKCLTTSFEKVAKEYTKAIHVAHVLIKLKWTIYHPESKA